MSLRNVGIVYRKEMVDSLRDRRTLISMVVVPVFLMPVLMVGMTSFSMRMVSKAEQEVPPVMVVGGEDSPKTVAALRSLKTIKIVPTQPDYEEQITNKQIRAAVERGKYSDPRAAEYLTNVLIRRRDAIARRWLSAPHSTATSRTP